MFFVGAYELTIDAKNRVSIPNAIRKKMNAEIEGDSFYVVPGRRPKTLALYSDKYFEKLRKGQPVGDALTEAAYEYRQWESAVTAFVEQDDQGRVLIPGRLLKKAGIDRDVVLTGAVDHLELWSRADFEAFENERWTTYPQERAKAADEINRLGAQRPDLP